MSLGKVIKELATQDGQKENKFTIPEGYTIEMTASKLEKEELCPPRNSLLQWRMQLWHQSIKMSFRKRKSILSVTGIYLSGYLLFIERYYRDQLVAKMLDEFDKSLIRQDRKKRKSLVWLWKKFWFVHLFYRKKQNFRRNIRLSQALFRIVLIKDEVTVRFHCCICYYKRPVWNRTSNV